jgi:DcuC family C4-dicarboxylate transporter
LLIGLGCFLVFLVFASLMYTRRLSALLALPLMALAIALIGGIPGPEVANQVVNKGALALHNAYTTTMFGAILAEMVNKQGIAKSLIRWVAEFAGDNPFVLGVLLTAVTALLFSTLGGLGAVIMVGTIVLPVMLSLGIPNLAAGGLFLFGISIGGMFNLTNWQLYMDVLNIEKESIIGFVVPFAGIVATLVVIFLAVQLGRLKNFGYVAVAIILVAAGLFNVHAN